MSNPKFKEQSDGDDAICPYCGDRRQVDSEDYDEDARVEECCNCGCSYWQNESFTVTHHTSPDCKINGDEHKYEVVTLPSGKLAKFCSVCDDCEGFIGQDRNEQETC